MRGQNSLEELRVLRCVVDDKEFELYDPRCGLPPQLQNPSIWLGDDVSQAAVMPTSGG